VNAKRVEERQLSGDVGDAEADGTLDGATAAAEAAAPAAVKHKSSKAAAAGGNAAKAAIGAATTGASSSTNAKARRRSRMSEGGDEKTTAPSQRSSQIGAVVAAAAPPEVPLLPLGAAGHDESTDFEDTPPSSSRHVRVRRRWTRASLHTGIGLLLCLGCIKLCRQLQICCTTASLDVKHCWLLIVTGIPACFCPCCSTMQRVARMPHQVTAHPAQQQLREPPAPPAGLAGWQQHLQQQVARRFVRPSRVKQLASRREQRQAGLVQVLLQGL
jgi:hypothetical protein